MLDHIEQSQITYTQLKSRNSSSIAYLEIKLFTTMSAMNSKWAKDEVFDHIADNTWKCKWCDRCFQGRIAHEGTVIFDSNAISHYGKCWGFRRHYSQLRREHAQLKEANRQNN